MEGVCVGFYHHQSNKMLKRLQESRPTVDTTKDGDSTFVVEDSVSAEEEERWRPPTPPKKMMRLDSGRIQ